LVLLTAILIALFVIQPAAVDTHLGVPHERIVLIWGVNISVNILVGYTLVLISLTTKSKAWMPVSIILLFILFILAFACNDAAHAYTSHGHNMRGASTVLFICAALEVIVWFLILSTLVFRKRIMSSIDQLEQDLL
jgi:uncharacterized membrane protein